MVLYSSLKLRRVVQYTRIDSSRRSHVSTRLTGSLVARDLAQNSSRISVVGHEKSATRLDSTRVVSTRPAKSRLDLPEV